MAQTSVKRREEIPNEAKWKLEDMYPSDEAWEQEYDKLVATADELRTFQGKLGDSAKTLLAFLKKKDEAMYYMYRIYAYANQRCHQDMAVAKYQDYVSKAGHVMMVASEAGAFSEPEILAIDEEKLNAFYQEETDLQQYRRAINEIRRAKEHTLSPEEEKLLAMTSEVANASENAYSMLNNADMTFPSIRDVEGNRIQVTNANFTVLQSDSDRSLRKQVYEGFYQTYGSWGNTIAAMYAGQVKADQFYAQVRHYSSARAMYLDNGNIPESVYDNLIEAVHKHMPAMYRYVALRKKLLDVEQLRMYDTYVPIIDAVEHKYTFEEAKELVLKALEPMGEEYLSIMRSGFESGWIDIYPNENKRGGAYCEDTYGTHPYVLLNFQGNLDSVFTLAHEMGHAMHSCYSNEGQPITYSRYLIFVAEVASTCNEALLMQYLLKNTQDKQERKYLINHYLDSFKSTLFRQTMFAEFEHIAHEKQAKGESLTKELLNQIYGDLIHLYFGPEMVVDEEIKCEWMRIPHFYMPYYVYQYATGYSAATAFSKKILTEGEPAVQSYISNFLKGGCSKDPIDLLKAAGVDMSTPEPVEQALLVFEEYLDMLEKEI